MQPMNNNVRKINWRLLFPLVLLVLAVGVYAKRGAIEDAIANWQKPDVAEVAFSDVGTATIVPLDDAGGAVPVEVEDEDTPAASDDVDDVVTPTTPTDTEDVPPTKSTTPATTSLPAEFNLAVPFNSQAPKSNWDEVHEETCEEAAALMAAYYYQGKPAGQINSDEADAALLKIVDFENSFFGFYKDTTAAQTASLLEAYFQLNAELIVDPTIEQIKSALVAGHPVIVPAAGQQLGNPNFTGAGPIYHNIILKGYTAKGFISNDPGTRLGADYFYSYDVLMNAIHDWNGGDVPNGQKIVIVVTP